MEHLWKSVSIKGLLALSVSGKRLLQLQSHEVKSPRDYELKLTKAEATRLSTYAACIITLEYPYNLHATTTIDMHGMAVPSLHLFDQLIDRYYEFAAQSPLLFGRSPTSNTSPITLRTLFPRLQALRGITGEFLIYRNSQAHTRADFTVPLGNPLQSVLQPLCKIYANRTTAIPLILSTSSHVTLMSHLIEPKYFLDVRRNERLEYLDVTRRRSWVVREDWAQIARQTGSSAEFTTTTTRPPLHTLSLTMFHVHHFFSRLVQPDMFGEVLPHLRTLRLKNLRDDHYFLPIVTEFIPSISAQSSPPSQSTRYSSDETSAYGGGSGPETVWPRITRRVVITDSDDEDIEPMPPGGYLATPRVSRDVPTSTNPVPTIPLTATALQQLEAPTLTEVAAEEAGHQTSEDLDLTVSSDEDKMRRMVSSCDGDSDMGHLYRLHGRKGTSYATALDDLPVDPLSELDISEASSSSPIGMDIQEPIAGPSSNPNPVNNNRLRFLNISSPPFSPSSSHPHSRSSTDVDDDDGVYNQPFPNIWSTAFTDEFDDLDEITDSTDNDDDDGAGSLDEALDPIPLDADEASASHGPVPPPNRSLLELIAFSCPNLEILSLNGSGWDFAALLRTSSKDSDNEADGNDEGEGQLTNIELGVDFCGIMDAEERTQILVNGIERALKQWMKGKAKGRSPPKWRR
ncbi:hypothetical protein FRB96_001044 [Tulasnella sp. 330]|nr:hypothetical protein FRB96_001044 [Tulasnella sp. 330]KAG8887700.1 hypothetical protein FRB98_009145 [Tulasnella sp. 332]